MNKYHAKKIKTPDGTFDSKAEYRRWCDLKLLEKAGEISHLKRQVPFKIAVRDEHICTYICDFAYVPKGDCAAIFEDVKGVKTPVYRLKRKLMSAVHGIEITEVAA